MTSNSSRQLSNFESTMFLLKKGVICSLGILYHQLPTTIKKRNRTTVKSNYHDTIWKNFLEEKKWLKQKNLKEFLILDPYRNLEKHSTKILLKDHNIWQITIHDYKKFEQNKQIKIFKKYVSDEPIAELGCGPGLHLFLLKSQNFKNRLEGYDISSNAIQACNLINDFFNCGINFSTLDLILDQTVLDLKEKTVFTYHVMEQLKYDTEKIILTILNSDPKQVLHFEPVKELYGNNLRDIVSSLYVDLVDYQDNLLKTLQKFEKQGLLEITNIERLGIGNPTNETTLIRWIPKTK